MKIWLASRDFVSGASLIAVGVLVIGAVWNLSQGTLSSIGPGMLPRWLAVAVVFCGLIGVLRSKTKNPMMLGRLPIRGPFFITLGISLFALTIRDIGLAVAGPLAIVTSGFASKETRFGELAIFSVVMTSACAGLFKFVLGQPIPILRLPFLQF